MRLQRAYLVSVLGLLLFLLAVGPAIPAASHGGQFVTSHPAISPAPQPSALLFIENAGQFDPDARFLVRGGPATLWLTQDAIWITVVDRAPVETPVIPHQMPPDQSKADLARPTIVNVKLSFPNANPQPTIAAFGQRDTAVHYYRGNDPGDWHSRVPVWSGVRYLDLYSGTDLEMSGVGGQWTWRLIRKAASQFDPHEVRLQVEGADRVTADDTWLHLSTRAGDVDLPLLGIPDVDWPSSAVVLEPEPGVFEVHAPCATTPPSGDPAGRASQDNPDALLYGTYLGGHDEDWVRKITVDQSGAAYLTGLTLSPNFPTTPGAPDPSLDGDMDAFVSKINPAGNGVADLVYSTYLGGTYNPANWGSAESGYGISVDSVGAVYVVGSTRSNDFPTTPNAFDTTFNGADPCPDYSPDVACMDGFVVKLDPAGGLAYASYLGGSGYTVPGGPRLGGDDVVEGVVAQSGLVYLTGWTRSDDFPTTPGAYDREYADVDIGLNTDVFVAKMNLAGNGSADLIYSTFVGGGVSEFGLAIAVDGAGTVYVTGYCDILFSPYP